AGSTGPLWTALVAVGVLLPVPDLLWMELLGILLHAGGVLLTYLLARRLGLSPALALLAGGLAAATGWLAWAALSGMEIALFVFLTLAGIVLHLDERAAPRRAPLSLAVLGVSALARPEGALLVALAAADRLLRFRRTAEGALGWERPGATGLRRLVEGLALAALAIGPVALFYAAIGGSPLPTTLAAKTGGGGAGVHLPDLRYLHTAAGVLFQAHPWLTLLAPAGSIALVRRLGTPGDRGLLPALWLFGLPLAYSCLTPAAGSPLLGNFGRYLFPLLPLLIVLGVLGLEPLAAGLAPGRGGAAGRRLLALAALAVLFVPTLAASARTAALYTRNLADVDRGDVAMARWLAERLPPEAVVATMDIGALAAILPNPIVDLAGIADPEVHAHIRRARAAGGTWQDGVLAFLADRRPDYLVVFPEWLTEVERPGSPFRRLHAIHVPGNVTLGRDTLALYSTPWTSYPLREHAFEPPPGSP
ncbi:MAG TPA: hypothetical protein VMR44_02990, partial [Thermoanaerobaculia bacterium]|nr:hypothetical protein [Thermoanaerobaculia bacterium]